MGAEIKEITWHLNADMTVVDLTDGSRLGFDGLLNKEQVQVHLNLLSEGY